MLRKQVHAEARKMKGCVHSMSLGRRTAFWAEISLALMIDANERVGHHHDEHCAIFPSSDCLMPTSSWANCSSARGSTSWQKIWGRVPPWFGARSVGRDRLGATSGGAATFQTHHTSYRAEATQATKLHFDWCLLTWRWLSGSLFVSPPDGQRPQLQASLGFSPQQSNFDA
jgi:hypothetical protein